MDSTEQQEPSADVNPPPSSVSINPTMSTGVGSGRGCSGGGIIDSLISGDRQGVGGALCNDPTGLCLVSKGKIDSSKSGVYTSIVRLASQLDSGGEGEVPLISIETDKAALLVKEYDGHTVAIRVPVSAIADERSGDMGAENSSEGCGSGPTIEKTDGLEVSEF